MHELQPLVETLPTGRPVVPRTAGAVEGKWKLLSFAWVCISWAKKYVSPHQKSSFGDEKG